ncbi:MAG: hypothetical protein EA349_00530, partial [Halomonadaceae bacterium]
MLAVILFALIPTTSHSESATRVFQVAVIDDVPSTQAATRILSAAYGKLGIHMETTITPSRRALLLADQGLVDGDLFRVEAVAQQYPNLVQVPYPLLQGQLIAVVAPQHDNQLPDIDDRPLEVAVRRGVIIAETTAQNLGMKLVLTDSYRQMRILLERGRVDLLLVSDIEGLSPLYLSAWGHLGRVPDPVAQFTLYHYLHH